MSQAACFKKRACCPPVVAAVEGATAILGGIESGQIVGPEADAWLAETIAADEAYVRRINKATKQLLASMEPPKS